NDFIIGGGLGWEHWFLQENKAWFNSFDIRDDMQQGLSLKAIEGHLGLNVEETSVPFDIDRPLTNAELQEVIKYCKHDVDTAEHLVKIRKPYLDGKIALGRLKDIPDVKSLYATNAKITAMFLGAEPTERYDEREYVYPPNLKKDLIPPEVIVFFDQIRDKSIPDDVLFKTKKKIMVDGCEFVYGWGGVHGGLPTYQEETTGKRVIVNFDVASLYPSLMIRCGYTSRNIPSAEFYESVYHDRLKAKKEGDKKTANTLKLCLNTTYGAMLNKYNPLYDPLMGRSVCISGQLFLTELVMAYLRDCETIKIINFNTDGVMFSIDKDEMPKIYTINEEWQNRTGFELEEDKIQKIVQKDVNNYIMVPVGELYDKDGKPRWKVKGGYLTYGMSMAGAWNINNNAIIVKKALAEYFVKGIPVEKTITECNEILEFQYIAKAGSKYTHCYQLINDKKVPVQKVNRVYATKDKRYGTLYKVHRETGRPAKIEDLPKHCIIDNRNELNIRDIDKEHYIQKAYKMISDFLGKEKEGGSMSNEYIKLSDLAQV
ncbi:MAG: DNA polymerase elongation subunit (family B), partial [Oligella ureolytica]|nr:DNA polymerase elongation subunit (family B) [Oligella ureolytica]